VSDGSLTASDTFVVTVNGSGAVVVSSASGFLNTVLSPTQSGAFTLQFDATPSVGAMDAVIGLSAANATAYADMAVGVRFNTSGTIDARNGSDYAAAQTVTYAGGSVYHFRLIVNIAAHVYTVYVTAPGANEVLLGSNYSFRTEQSAVATIGFWSASVVASGTLTVGGIDVSSAVSNSAPTITDLPNRAISASTNTGAIPFTIGDAETADGDRAARDVTLTRDSLG
jgi:hypothetical protein